MHTIRRLRTENAGVLRGVREFLFTDGFNILRGKNEGGKSTVLESIAVCLFGAQAIRGSWEDFVTTGKKVSELKLELEIGPYIVKRSKGSASVTGAGVKISGHNDVSSFFLDLLGITKGAEKNIMVAEQNNIRGILEKGPADTTKFIEDLAGFVKIDQVVAKVKETFPTLDRKTVEEMLEGYEKNLQKAREVSVPSGDTERELKNTKEAELKKITDKVSELEGRSNELQEKLNQLNRKLNNKSLMEGKVESLESIVSESSDSMTRCIKKQSDIESELEAIEEDRVESENFLSDITARVHRRQAYETVLNFSEEPEVYWDEGLDSFLSRLKEVSEELKKKKEQLRGYKQTLEALEERGEEGAVNRDATVFDFRTAIEIAKRRIKEEEQNLSNATTCSKCGSDISDRVDEVNNKIKVVIADIKRRQKETETELAERESLVRTEYKSRIQALKEGIEATQSSVDALSEELSTLDQLQAQQKAVEKAINSECGSHKGLFRVVEENNIPWVLEWTGTVPEEIDDQLVESHRAIVRKVDQLEVSLRAVEDEITSLEDRKDKAQEALRPLNFDLNTLEIEIKGFDSVQNMEEELSSNKEKTRYYKEEVENLRVITQEIQESLQEIEQQRQKKEDNIALFQSYIDEAKQKLQESKDNYDLHRAVSKARSEVIEQVWSTLLTAAEDCFSSIRGQQSTIKKEDKHFLVDDMKVVRLSGSAQDSLGISLRSAIRDVFAPETDFLLMDEIAQGMDEERTVSALSQVAALNVSQTILCTHEEISDAMASNIIEV